MLTNHDLKYHFHPAKGWINDPNGLCCFNGKYHIFYQHCPNNEHPWREPCVWGHCETEDFLNFKELPIAISSDRYCDERGIWSGTAIEKDGILYAYYASIDPNYVQTINLATSKDGIHFEKYEGNPIIPGAPADGSYNFRDPAVIKTSSGCYMVIASSNEERHTANLLLYKSENMINWDYIGVMREYENSRFCECPSFVPCGEGYVLSTSVSIDEDHHYFEVMYGDFDGKIFSPKITSRFQKGPDEYAGQIFHADDGRNILISWISGWAYHPEDKCIGCLSLPLEIIVEADKIRAYPVKEVQHLLDENDCLVDAYVKEYFVNKGEEVYIELLEKPDPEPED